MFSSELKSVVSDVDKRTAFVVYSFPKMPRKSQKFSISSDQMSDDLKRAVALKQGLGEFPSSLKKLPRAFLDTKNHKSSNKKP